MNWVFLKPRRRAPDAQAWYTDERPTLSAQRKYRLSVSGLKYDKIQRALRYRESQLLLIEEKMLLEHVGDEMNVDLMSLERAEVSFNLCVLMALVVGPGV